MSVSFLNSRKAAKAAVLGVSLLFLTGLSGCAVFSAQPHVGGHPVSEAELTLLNPGVTTERTAQSLLGTPTATGTLQPDYWIYIEETVRPQILSYPKILNQRVVTLTFSKQGILQKIGVYTLKDAVNVPMASGATPSPGGHVSLLKEIIGGIGSYSPIAAGSLNQ